MPIEIRELVIKARVDNGNAAGNSNGNSSGNNDEPGEELIKICVDKVLEILKDRNER